jgi:predicted nucleotidyltransferase
MNKQDTILKRIIGVVDKTAPEAEVYLYGSRARGDSKHLSDWDILILVNSKRLSFDLETKFMDEFYEVELDTGEIITPLVYTKNDWNKKRYITPLYENIKKEGVRIK